MVYEAYMKYGFLSTGQIERLRLKHRLRVVQELEDNSERNIIRSVAADNYFTIQEIQVSPFFILRIPKPRLFLFRFRIYWESSVRSC